MLKGATNYALALPGVDGAELRAACAMLDARAIGR